MKPILPALLFASCLALSSAHADASVSTATETRGYWEMVYPIFEDDEAEIKAAINADLYLRAYRIVNDGEKNASRRLDYKLMREDGHYLSLLFFLSRYEAGEEDPVHRVYAFGVVYDKTTGEEVPLSRLADVTVEDLIRLQRAGHFYRCDGTPIPTDHIQGQPQRVPEDYFLNDRGQIFVLFSPDLLARPADGITAIDVTDLKKPGAF